MDSNKFSQISRSFARRNDKETTVVNHKNITRRGFASIAIGGTVFTASQLSALATGGTCNVVGQTCHVGGECCNDYCGPDHTCWCKYDSECTGANQVCQTSTGKCISIDQPDGGNTDIDNDIDNNVTVTGGNKKRRRRRKKGGKRKGGRKGGKGGGNCYNCNNSNNNLGIAGVGGPVLGLLAAAIKWRNRFGGNPDSDIEIAFEDLTNNV